MAQTNRQRLDVNAIQLFPTDQDAVNGLVYHLHSLLLHYKVNENGDNHQTNNSNGRSDGCILRCIIYAQHAQNTIYIVSQQMYENNIYRCWNFLRC